jgi:hypothetical protein
MPRHPTDTVNLRLRLPEGLRQSLANEAEKANRSLNSEVLWRLGRSLGPEWEELVQKAEEREKREDELIERLRRDPEFRARLAKLPPEAKRKR